MAAPFFKAPGRSVQRMIAEKLELPHKIQSHEERIKALVTALNQGCPNGWAFSGSFALWLWAKSKGVASREPGDIDILVSIDAYHRSVPDLYPAVLPMPKRGFAGMGGKGWTAEIEKGLDIDWIIESVARGKLSDCVQLNVPGLGTVNIIKLDVLLDYKTKMSDTGTKKGQQAEEDTLFIKKLLG